MIGLQAPSLVMPLSAPRPKILPKFLPPPPICVNERVLPVLLPLQLPSIEVTRNATVERPVSVTRGAHADAALETAAARLNPDEDDLIYAEEFSIPSDVTRSRASVLAHRIVKSGMDRQSWRLLVPRFEAGSDGAVGLHWRTNCVELLIVIPPTDAERIDYFGDTPSGAKIKGELAGQESVTFLAEWLGAHESSG